MRIQCVQIGDDALKGRTHPIRIQYWADSVPVLRWPKRKLRRNVSENPIPRPIENQCRSNWLSGHSVIHSSRIFFLRRHCTAASNPSMRAREARVRCWRACSLGSRRDSAQVQAKSTKMLWIAYLYPSLGRRTRGKSVLTRARPAVKNGPVCI